MKEFSTRARLSVALNDAGIPDDKADSLATRAWESPCLDDDEDPAAAVTRFLLAEALETRSLANRLNATAQAIEKAVNEA